jgi:hypothetical protein
MRIYAVTFTVLLIALTACSPGDPSTLPAQTETSRPTVTLEPSPTDSPSATPPPTPTATATPTLSPTSTSTPTSSPTPTGGGSGVVLLEACRSWDDCSRLELSIAELSLQDSTRPYLKVSVVNPDTYKYRMVLYDPTSGESTTILECSDEYTSCYQRVFSGSLEQDWLFLAQEYQRKLYDGHSMTDIYRLNTTSLETTLIDHFEGRTSSFRPLLESSKGLLSITDDQFHGELILYDLEKLERVSILKRRGSFFLFGPTPDPRVFWYRIADYCETELVSDEGKRVAQLKNSDGILNWIDDEVFLLFTASNNPPFCTGSGIALANIHGLTGQWITTTRADWAMMSPNGEKIFFSSNCNNQGCIKLMMADRDGSNSKLLLESPERFNSYGQMGVFSPDGTKMLFSAGKQLWMTNTDGSNPQVTLETDKEWRIVGWLGE